MREYELLSKLFEYPDSSYKQSIVDIADNIKEKYPLASKELMELHSKLPNDIYKLQELYTKSFEVQAITSLEIGYVLYGDDYTRGEILANLSAEQKRVGNSCDMELPDHLSNILRLISRLEDRELLDDLVTLMVAPAVENMIKEFTPSSIREKERFYKKKYKTLIVPTTPLGTYLHLFNALHSMLDSDFELIKENRPFADVSFFGFLKSELEVEEGKKSSNSCSMRFDNRGMPISSCGI
jgi:nitrate reductase assembly molybdenum cofactor insertion protein NarJ